MTKTPLVTTPESLFKEFLFILFCQKKIIIICFVSVFSLSIAIAFMWPPSYSTFGQIMFKGKKSKLSPDTLSYVEQKSMELRKEDLVSEGQLLASLGVIRHTVNNLSKQENDLGNSLKNEKEKEDLVHIIKEAVKVDVVPYSRILEVCFVYKNARHSKIILDELIRVYIQERYRIFNPKELHDFLDYQFEEFKRLLMKEEEKLVDLAKKNITSDPSKEITNNLHVKMQWQLKQTQLEIALQKLKQKAAYIEKTLQDEGFQFYAFIKNETISKLSTSLQSLIVQRSEDLLIYMPKSPIISYRNEQVKNAQDILHKEVEMYHISLKEEINNMKKTLEDLEGKIEKIENRNLVLYETKISWERIQRDMNQQADIVETFARRLKEAKMSEGNEVETFFSISLLAKPQEPQSPFFPKPKVIIIMGAISGMLLGCCFAFIIEFFDHTFKRPNDVEQFIGLPALFSIPYDKKSDKKYNKT